MLSSRIVHILELECGCDGFSMFPRRHASLEGQTWWSPPPCLSLDSWVVGSLEIGG